jgi:hypothetical protein
MSDIIISRQACCRTFRSDDESVRRTKTYSAHTFTENITSYIKCLCPTIGMPVLCLNAPFISRHECIIIFPLKFT